MSSQATGLTCSLKPPPPSFACSSPFLCEGRLPRFLSLFLSPPFSILTVLRRRRESATSAGKVVGSSFGAVLEVFEPVL